MSACSGPNCTHPEHEHTPPRPEPGLIRLSTKDGASANRAERRAWAKRNGVKPGRVVRP